MIMEFACANHKSGAEILANHKAVRARLFNPPARKKAVEAVVLPFAPNPAVALPVPSWKKHKITFDAHEIAYRINRMRNGSPKRVYLMQLLEEIGVSYEEITSKSRRRAICKPRQYVIWRMKQAFPSASLPELGRMFGGFDHTVILHAIRVVQAAVDAGKNLKREFLI